LLYCFFIIELARRKILHFNLTATRRRNGCSKLPAALPEAGRYRYVILDRDAKFDDSVTTFLQATGLPNEPACKPLAEWNCRALDRKLPPFKAII